MTSSRNTPTAGRPRTHESARQLLTDLDVRPLSARSLLLSYLLGTHPPSVSAARLVDFGSLFGLRPGTTRTALSRMVTAGEATTDEGRYRLAGRLLDRQRELDRGRVSAADEPWDGTWWTVIVTAEARTATERRRFRSTMEGARLGELRPDTWMRPANVDGPTLDAGVIATRGPLTTGDDSELAGRLWSLPEIEATSARLLDALLPLADALHDGDDLDTTLPLTFEVSAACVRHLRTEPQLPTTLVDNPASRSLRSTYAGVNELFVATLDQHLRRRGSGSE